MKKIIIVYSPLCEANGAFIRMIHEWLENQNIEIEECSYEVAIKKYKKFVESSSNQNCFINVYYEEKCIDFVPLHKERLLTALGLKSIDPSVENTQEESTQKVFSEDEIRNQMKTSNIEFIPITKNTYYEEMSMCLQNYPRGNPAIRFHRDCIRIKEKIYTEIFQKVTVAGLYAKLNGIVIGLLEVFPREIVRKYGYMTGTLGKDSEILTVACYEVGYGIPRTYIIDELMYYLLNHSNLLSRKIIEGIGIYEWNDGFNPYWAYEKYGFHKTEQKDKNTAVMTKKI